MVEWKREKDSEGESGEVQMVLSYDDESGDA